MKCPSCKNNISQIDLSLTIISEDKKIMGKIDKMLVNWINDVIKDTGNVAGCDLYIKALINFDDKIHRFM